MVEVELIRNVSTDGYKLLKLVSTLFFSTGPCPS
jgi:hypothetical protein